MRGGLFHQFWYIRRPFCNNITHIPKLLHRIQIPLLTRQATIIILPIRPSKSSICQAIPVDMPFFITNETLHRRGRDPVSILSVPGQSKQDSSTKQPLHKMKKSQRKSDMMGFMPLYVKTKLTDLLHEARGFRTDYQFPFKNKIRVDSPSFLMATRLIAQKQLQK